MAAHRGVQRHAGGPGLAYTRSKGRLYFFPGPADPAFGSVVRGLDPEAMIRPCAPRNGGDPSRPGKKDPVDPLGSGWRSGRASRRGRRIFGRGRPGWHVEWRRLSRPTTWAARSTSRAGGRDLIFPAPRDEARVTRQGLPLTVRGRRRSPRRVRLTPGPGAARRREDVEVTRQPGVRSPGPARGTAMIRWRSGWAILAHHYRG